MGRHLHVPYAYPALRETLTRSAEKVVRNYLGDNASDFENIEFSEKSVEISLGGGVTVSGRIDLVRRRDSNETAIVDLKSTDRAQAEQVTEKQLHIYALGYRELTGRDADFVEIYNLDEREKKPRRVEEGFIGEVKRDVRRAAAALRDNRMPTETSRHLSFVRLLGPVRCGEGFRRLGGWWGMKRAWAVNERSWAAAPLVPCGGSRPSLRSTT